MESPPYSEAYDYDAAGNTTKQTIGATTSTMTYDRNRLTKTVTGATTLNQRYDPFGRSTTADVGAQVVEQNAYDGYDRLVRQQKFDTAGTPTLTRNSTYDPFDRVTSQSEKVGAGASVSTRYTFVGLADQVAAEEEKDTSGTWKVSKSYAYGAGGENLSLVDTPVNTTTTKKSFYGTNPHGDVETLTDATTGSTTSTYRYTAYGQADQAGTTGDDAITGNANQDADIVNPYRFNSKRFNGATGTYDMGFREYNPGLNRFLTRDMFEGALSDLSLGMDPWNTNRYMFGGGNPISRVELTGHYAVDGYGNRESWGTPTITAPGTTGSTLTPAQTQSGPSDAPADWLRSHPDSGGDVDVNREALGNILKDIGWMGLGAVVTAAGGSLTGGGTVVCGGSAGILCPPGAVAVVGGIAISAAGAAVTATGTQRFSNDWGRLLSESYSPGSTGSEPPSPKYSTRQEKAGELAGKYTEGQSTRDPSSQWYHEYLSNDMLLEEINNAAQGEGIVALRNGKILGGHHRWDELQARINSGRIDPNTRINIQIYLGE
ncbi:RHS repeat-associated core domain-containing protein [Kribbella sp. NPDC050241]|uniref:RHS repeat-associated core domain-containing protein n=1 Tax=Kribbella sp. NPDC050241 TaxID=3364115 RepID=UPI0037AFC706